MWIKFKKWFLAKILKKKYYRTGKCNGCGQCCTHIYVKHYKHVIQDEKEFEKLQYLHSFYAHLKVIGKDDIGLIFECQNLDKETHKCKIHKFRPAISSAVRIPSSIPSGISSPSQACCPPDIINPHRLNGYI